jgi:hypothetical protein
LPIPGNFQTIENTQIAPMVLWHSPCTQQHRQHKKGQGISQAGTPVANRGATLTSFSSQLIERIRELERIPADDEQHVGASPIRQTVPTSRSSTA